MIGQDTTSLLKIEHLFKSFQDQLVLNDISLNISPKKILGILGPNGAGKTTLLRVISGLLPMDSGKIDRKNIVFGYSPQSPVFWKNLTTYEQMKYNSDLFRIPKHHATERIHFLCTKLGLTKKATEFVERLSGGMQKRLNLAMALVHEPKLLLLDEPTANLDLESKGYVRELLNYLVKEEDVSILCSSHDFDEISEISDEVIFMDKGRIVHTEKFADQKQNEISYVRLKEIYTNMIVGTELV